jgi:hypothetical protein
MSKPDPLVLLEDIMLAIQKIGRYTSQWIMMHFSEMISS